jgi:hypothetical protein
MREKRSKAIEIIMVLAILVLIAVIISLAGCEDDPYYEYESKIEDIDGFVIENCTFIDPNEPNDIVLYVCGSCGEGFGEDEGAIYHHACKGYPISKLIHQIEALEQRVKVLEKDLNDLANVSMRLWDAHNGT